MAARVARVIFASRASLRGGRDLVEDVGLHLALGLERVTDLREDGVPRLLLGVLRLHRRLRALQALERLLVDATDALGEELAGVLAGALHDGPRVRREA